MSAKIAIKPFTWFELHDGSEITYTIFGAYKITPKGGRVRWENSNSMFVCSGFEDTVEQAKQRCHSHLYEMVENVATIEQADQDQIDVLHRKLVRLESALIEIAGRRVELSQRDDYCRGFNDGVYRASSIAFNALVDRDD